MPKMKNSMSLDGTLPIVNRRGFKRTVPMQVLCLGMSRSGTESLCNALTILGIPTYHGFHASYNHWDAILWREAAEAKWENKGEIWGREDFDQILGDFSACTDFPSAGFAVELMNAYPEAKVVLNKRPFDKWYNSYLNAIQVPLMENVKMSWLTQLDFEARSAWNFWTWFHGMYFRKNWYRNSRLVYEEHNALIRGAAPKEQFLEWEVGEGWGPLCEFLDKPVPNEPFPSGNEVDVLLYRLKDEVYAPKIARGLRRFSLAIGVAAVLTGVATMRYMRPDSFHTFLDVLSGR